MTTFDTLRESFAEHFKRLCLERRLQFPMELSFAGEGWEVGALTDGEDIRMFTCGTAPRTGWFPLRTMHGVDATGKHFTIEVAG